MTEGGYSNLPARRPEDQSAQVRSAAIVQPRTSLACENCKRIASPRTFRVTIMEDGGLREQRDLCRACATQLLDAAKRPASWLGAAL